MYVSLYDNQILNISIMSVAVLHFEFVSYSENHS